MMKVCPFKNEICNDICPLFINPQDLNDYMVSKLTSLEVKKKDEGICSFKILSLSQARTIFENSNTNNSSRR